jgi:hypothetical protein
LSCLSINYYTNTPEEIDKLIQLLEKFNDEYLEKIELFLNNKIFSTLNANEKIVIIEFSLIDFISNF